MATTMDLAPVAAGERIEAMDVLRGFALLGILLMNIEGMAGPLAASFTGVDPALAGADRTVDWLIYVLVQGKFYTLFSLLFGMGFATMALRAERTGRPFGVLYLRRSLALLGFGLVHGLLIWSGDILLVYALLSFLLLAFRPVATAWLPWLGMGAYLLPAGFMLLVGAVGSLVARMPAEAAAGFNEAMAQAGSQFQALLEGERAAYGSGSYADAVAQRARDVGFMLGNLPVMAGSIFGMLLIGAWFARSGALAQPARFPRLFAALRWGALPAGLALALGSAALEPTMRMDHFDLRSGVAMAVGMLGSLGLCLGYAAWLVRGLQSTFWQRPLRWLAPAGRMALSNYLLQSLACTWIFYGYGLGYFEQLPRVWQPLFVLALFVVQVVLSRWWLMRFRFGPAEWLWRSLTYLRLQPMRPDGRLAIN